MIELYKSILENVGEDPEREGLIKTPERASKAMKFLTQGYTQNLDDVFNGAIFNEEYDEMVVVKDIEFYSLCEHHILPFWGTCDIAYIPDGKIVGLSKLGRLVDHFARRLQVQERFTKEISDTILEYLNPKGVAVIVRAQHLCMMMRGIEKQNSFTITSSMNGCFKTNITTRNEFLSLTGKFK